MFAGYIKIPETSAKWNLTTQETKLMKTTKWVVLEKVHGANFCFVFDNDNKPFLKKVNQNLIIYFDFWLTFFF